MEYIHEGIKYVRVPYEKDGVGCDECCFSHRHSCNHYCTRPDGWSCVNLEPFKDLYVFKKFIPKRIQRKRTKGWRMPENTVYVGRGTKWGNPFVVTKELNSYEACQMYAECVDAPNKAKRYFNEPKATEMEKYFNRMANSLDELEGKDLACWCPLDKECHADILIEMFTHANSQ